MFILVVDLTVVGSRVDEGLPEVDEGDVSGVLVAVGDELGDISGPLYCK